MEKVTNVAEICNLIRNKLIEYGVQEHTAWYNYNQNYRPVIFFSQLALWQNLKPVSLWIFDKIISSLSSHFVQIKGLVVKFNRLLQV